jgi:zinc/manganese transport system ATP-binding protein
VTFAPVRVEGVGLRFGRRQLWEGLSFELAAGEFLAVLGPNGTGKTSLIRMIMGLLKPSGGVVEVNGRAPVQARAGIGYIPQHRAFDPDLPLRGRDLVRLGLDGQRWGLGGAGRKLDERVGQALREVGAAAYADQPVGRLSGGEQQRLRIAQALVSDPGLLLADEPLLSLDLASQRMVTSLLDGRRRAAGTSSSSPTTSTRCSRWSTGCSIWPPATGRSVRRGRCLRATP